MEANKLGREFKRNTRGDETRSWRYKYPAVTCANQTKRVTSLYIHHPVSFGQWDNFSATLLTVSPIILYDIYVCIRASWNYAAAEALKCFNNCCCIPSCLFIHEEKWINFNTCIFTFVYKILMRLYTLVCIHTWSRSRDSPRSNWMLRDGHDITFSRCIFTWKYTVAVYRPR